MPVGAARRRTYWTPSGCGATRPSFTSACPAPSAGSGSNNIAFSAVRAVHPTDPTEYLYTINSDGSGIVQLTPADWTAWVRWASDASEFLLGNNDYPVTSTFAAFLADPTTGLNTGFVFDSSTAINYTQLRGPGDLSPDNSKSAIPATRNSDSIIGILIIAGHDIGRSYNFVPKPGMDTSLPVLWRPDNGGLLYHAPNMITSNTEVHTCALDGSGDTVVLADRTGCWSWQGCDWATDSSCFLAVWSNAVSGVERLYRVSTDGTEGTLLYDDVAGGVLSANCAYSPDQATIVMGSFSALRTMPAGGGSWTAIFSTPFTFTPYVDW